jgi:parvulin-like peptidyl-prolyl isomerase
MAKFKKIILFLLLTSSLQSLVFGLQSYAYAESKIVAIVNNDVITQKDLDDFLNFLRLQMTRDVGAKEAERKIETMKKDLLEKLIEDRLIVQEAKKSNIRVDDSRVKAKLAEIKSNYPAEQAFQDEMIRQGIVQADLEAKIRDQFLMYAVVDVKIRENIVVKPDEVTDFYNQNPSEFLTGEVREATVVSLENADLAKTFCYNFRAGQKIENLATRYPFTVDMISAEKNGELRKDIENVIFKLNVSEISDPVKIDEKYYVFRLDNIILPRQLALKEVRHKVYNFLFEKKMQEGLVKWLDDLKKQSYIKIY